MQSLHSSQPIPFPTITLGYYPTDDEDIYTTSAESRSAMSTDSPSSSPVAPSLLEARAKESAAKADLISNFIIKNAANVKRVPQNKTAINAANKCLAESVYLKKIEWLEKIQRLDLTGAKLNEVPSEIVLLQNLKILDLSTNLLATLPEEMAQLPSLCQLNIAGNKFKVWPEFLIERKIKTLNHITAHNNFFGTYSPTSIKKIVLFW